MTQAQLLASTFNEARNLTNRYIDRIQKGDLLKQIMVDDVKMNCGLWIIAHLVSTENSLLLFGTGAQPEKREWLKHFGFGTTSEPQEGWPAIDEVLNDMKLIHEKAMTRIASLTNEQLDEDNLTPIHFNGDKSKRIIIQHAIRHEGMHCGHLAWLCKMQKLK